MHDGFSIRALTVVPGSCGAGLVVVEDKTISVSNLILFGAALRSARSCGQVDGVDGAATSPAEAFVAFCAREHSEGWFESFPPPQCAAIRDAYDKAWARGLSLRHLLPANTNALRRVD